MECAAEKYEPLRGDPVDVLFGQALQKHAGAMHGVAIRRIGQGKYTVNNQKLFVRAVDAEDGKILKVRRGGAFQPFDEWVESSMENPCPQKKGDMEHSRGGRTMWEGEQGMMMDQNCDQWRRGQGGQVSDEKFLMPDPYASALY